MRLYIVTANWGGGGPGGIAADLYRVAEEQGWDCRFAYGRGEIPSDVNSYKIGTNISPLIHVASARVFDNAGFVGKKSTQLLIEDIKRFKPDVINLHNPLRYTMNTEVLFDYFKRVDIPVVWTMHDCWGFTGHCITGICENLKNGCGNCPNKKEYPECYVFDRSRENLERKKRAFSGIKNLSLISPSKWLANVASTTYLNQYPITVIPNGIDLEVFKPTDSDIRAEYGLDDKKIVLAVAGEWTSNKGARYIYRLAEMLDNSFAIVMIGKNNDRVLKTNNRILHIEHTSDRTQLAQWYTAADVFINPTMGDNFPTVNLEALACGTPVVTFDTGGSGESVGDCGSVVEQEDVDGLAKAIYDIMDNRISVNACLLRASLYDKKTRYREYMQEYYTKIKEI